MKGLNNYRMENIDEENNKLVLEHTRNSSHCLPEGIISDIA